jgi:hypothetical protein
MGSDIKFKYSKIEERYNPDISTSDLILLVTYQYTEYPIHEDASIHEAPYQNRGYFIFWYDTYKNGEPNRERIRKAIADYISENESRLRDDARVVWED